MAPARKRKKLASIRVTKYNMSKPNTKEAGLQNHAANILEAVKKARKCSQDNLRIELRKFVKELDKSRIYGRDPLQLFPQEIWELILSFVNDINDLANFARACTLFQTIVNSSNQELFFGKVIPFILPYFYDADGNDYHLETLLACGQVCKKWRAGVDSFAGNYFCSEKFLSSGLDKLKMEPTKYFENKSLLIKKGFINFLPLSKEEENGRIESGELEVRLESSDSEDDDNGDMQQRERRMRRAYRRYMRNKRKQLKIGNCPFLTTKSMYPSMKPSELASLKIHGQLVWSVSLEVGESTQTTNAAQKFWTVFSSAIEYCPNLKCLEISNYFEAPLIDAVFPDKELMEQLKPRTNLKLESFVVDEESVSILPIQIGISRALSSTLEHVKVHHWNNEMSSLPWDKLTSLEILGRTTIQILKSLEKMTAANMHKLNVQLNFSAMKLTLLFKCINKFPKLDWLVLQFTGAVDNCTAIDIAGIPLELLTINRITTLEIISSNPNASRNLSLLFPMIRNLVFRYRNIKKDSSTESDSEGNWSYEKIQNKISSQRQQYIQVYEGTHMYKSNIWSLLPQLQNLRIAGELGSLFGEKKTLKTFERQGYIFETEKYLHGQQLHLKQVWAEAKKQIREKLRKQLCNLNRIAGSNKQKAALRSRKKDAVQCKPIDENMYKQVLPFIVPILANGDVQHCRLVSKAWWKSIKDQVKPVYTFEFPLTTKQEKEKFQSNLRKSQAAPYFARNIVIQLKSNNPSSIDISLMLEVIGKYIIQLTISAKENVIPEMVDIYNICLEITNKCPELRMLSFQVPKLFKNSESEYKKLKRLRTLLCPKYLERMCICAPEDDCNGALDQLLKDLGNMCHSQLKSLQQVTSNSDIVHFNNKFEKLEELTITNFVANDLINDEGFIPNAPKLERLCLCLSDGDMTIDYLATLAKEHPQLMQIELQFGYKFHEFNTNLVYTNPKNNLKVTTATVVCKSKTQVSLDFLVHMPFLRTLSITYGSETKLPNGENKITEKRHEVSMLPPRQPDKDFIQLVRYLKDDNLDEHDTDNISRSNIWMVLRRLETLKIVYCSSNKIQQQSVFNRP